MNYFQFNKQDFEEYLLDTDKKTFSKQNCKEVPVFTIDRQNLGFIDVKTEQKGQIILMNNKMLFKQNIIFKGTLKESIIVFFNKKDESFTINQKTGLQRAFLPNNNGIYFRNHDTNEEQDVILRGKEIDVSFLHIPITYFKKLTNLYPNLFEQSFTRFQKGESFFLSENFARTTAVHYNILSQIENSHLMGTCSSAYVDAKILELLSMYFQYVNSNKTTYPNQLINYDKIKEAEFILISELNNPPSVKELALQVGVNPNILQSGFKRIFNTTVYGYLFEYKMQLAEQLLKDTSKSITEIAEQCGYNYTSHFCTAFKRRFGVSPAQRR